MAMCIFHCQGLPVPRFWHLLSNLPWDVAVADVALAPTVARTDWLKAQAAMETMETMFCTILYWFSQILANLFVDPFISLECLHPESSWQFLDRMPCWTGSPGTLSDTSCTGHHGRFDGEDSSSVIHIPSQYMYVSEIGINTRPFQQGKWWWTHEALDLGIPNLETNAYCPFHQEREGKGQIQRQYPAVVPSNSDKLLVPITVLSCRGSAFQSRFRSSGIWRNTSKVLRDSWGFCPQRRCDLQSTPSPAIQYRYCTVIRKMMEDVNLHPLLFFYVFLTLFFLWWGCLPVNDRPPKNRNLKWIQCVPPRFLAMGHWGFWTEARGVSPGTMTRCKPAFSVSFKVSVTSQHLWLDMVWYH